MPCLFGLLAVGFPRVAIVLLWFFTSFFSGVHNVILAVVGFLFLPLTFIVYTYLQRTNAGTLGTQSLIFLLIALILDLGLVGGGTFRRRGR